jgi:hypothetical protein
MFLLIVKGLRFLESSDDLKNHRFSNDSYSWNFSGNMKFTGVCTWVNEPGGWSNVVAEYEAECENRSHIRTSTNVCLCLSKQIENVMRFCLCVL